MGTKKPGKSLSLPLRVSVVANTIRNGGSLVGMAGVAVSFDQGWFLVRLDGDKFTTGFRAEEIAPEGTRKALSELR
jgi:hypothetical protein